jgi:hypothetical protein
MTFVPREVVAFFLQAKGTLREFPLYSTLIFAGMFVMMTFSPYDFIFKIVNLLYYFLGMAYGFVQVRLLNTIIRRGDVYKWQTQETLPFAILGILSDQGIECLFRPLLSGEQTSMSSPFTMFFTAIGSIILYLATHANQFTPYLGLYKPRLPVLIWSFVLGMFNSSMSIGVYQEAIKPTATPRAKVAKAKEHEE